MLAELREALTRLRLETATRAVVLRSGVPGAFCAGADLRERATMTRQETAEFVGALRATMNELAVREREWKAMEREEWTRRWRTGVSTPVPTPTTKRHPPCFPPPTLFSFSQSLPMPTIASIDGYALGGGAELALACDLRVVGPRAVFAFPEARLGIIPG